MGDLEEKGEGVMRGVMREEWDKEGWDGIKILRDGLGDGGGGVLIQKEGGELRGGSGVRPKL